MKKTAQLALCVWSLLAVFFIATPAKASMILFAPNVPENYVSINSGAFASTTAAGTAGSVLVYLQAKTPANTATQFWIQVTSDVSGQTCSSATTTLSDLGIVVGSTFTPGNSSYRALPMGVFHSGDTSCVFGINDRLEVLVAGGFSPGGNVGMGGFNASSTDPTQFKPWWLLTTDTASSTIYVYQQQGIGISTSTTATFCNGSYSGSGIGDIIANALCNVSGFLFVPDTTALNNFSSLQQVLATKIPFSYFYGLATLYESATATTSASFINLSYNLHDLGIGSTTALGNLLPNAVVLSSSTVTQYDTVGFIPLTRTVAGYAIWLGFAYYVYRRTSGLFHKTT